MKEDVPRVRGLRLDLILKSGLLSAMSRSRIQSIIKAGHVLVRGVVEKSASRLVFSSSDVAMLSDVSDLSVPPAVFLSTAEMPDVEVVFDDPNFLVLNKPANISVHKGHDENEVTVVDFLINKFGEGNLSKVRGVKEAGVVHRLDKDTTGLMVIAKNDESHHFLAQQIHNNVCHRAYLALCYGSFVPAVGTIRTFLSRDQRDYRRYVSNSCHTPCAREAVSKYTTKKIFCGGRLSLVEFVLSTGRTHQIRVHAVASGHPVVGDQVYRDEFCNRLLRGLEEGLKKRILFQESRQMLHAHRLSFISPSNGELLVFNSTLMPDMSDLLACIENAPQG